MSLTSIQDITSKWAWRRLRSQCEGSLPTFLVGKQFVSGQVTRNGVFKSVSRVHLLTSPPFNSSPIKTFPVVVVGNYNYFYGKLFSLRNEIILHDLYSCRITAISSCQFPSAGGRRARGGREDSYIQERITSALAFLDLIFSTQFTFFLF